MIQMKILLAVALAVIVLLLFAVGGGVGLLLKSNFMDSGKFLNTISIHFYSSLIFISRMKQINMFYLFKQVFLSQKTMP